MGKGKTGRPPGIDSWKQRQYLDLERRRLHIPDGMITRQMLAEELRIESTLPVGIYGGEYITITSKGRPVFGNELFGGRYGMCVYGMVYAVYGWETTYGVGLYGTARYAGDELLYGIGIYGESEYL